MVKKWDITIPRLSGKRTRRGYIYLPDDYDENPDRRYPVMYMFDGHNVFFDSDATYGKSWGMNSFMSWSRKNLIIVAVECNHRGNGRLQEYSPVDFENEALGKIKGKGRSYMNWLVKELKPMIDGQFRTFPDRKNTIICGSSMGGLMALYGVTCYNKYFQKAACLSPSLWVSQEKIFALIEKAKVSNDTCIYMDYGSRELANHGGNHDALIDMAKLLYEKQVNLTFRIIPGGTHSEASWEKQIPIFMDCLGL